jgi:hypothetical protein
MVLEVLDDDAVAAKAVYALAPGENLLADVAGARDE